MTTRLLWLKLTAEPGGGFKPQTGLVGATGTGQGLPATQSAQRALLALGKGSMFIQGTKEGFKRLTLNALI